MAFDAFRAQSEAPARTGRKTLWYAVSIAFHGALIAAGVAYSFWHIEELSPPMLKLTFMSAAPPPPPAAPAGGGTAAKKTKTQIKKPVVQQKPDLVQPRETIKEPPKEEPKQPEDHGEKDGLKGGTVGGTPGGTIGGTPGGTIGGTPGGKVGASPAPSKFLLPNVGEAQKLSGGKPDFPPSLRKPGAVYQLLVKIYVDMNGNVDKVVIMKGEDPLLERAVLEKLKTWKFRPFMVNGTPAPFSYPQRIEFRTE